MNIVSLRDASFSKRFSTFDIYTPSFVYFKSESLTPYLVQKGEEMRIDLVIMSIYDDARFLEDTDVILFINNIDNPLNINVGDVIYYPPSEQLDSFRAVIESLAEPGSSVKKALATPNKTQRKDSNRKKFVDSGYALPPVVLDESKPPVRLEDGKIVIGGLNSR
jgi:hypothetical protein